MSQYGKTIRTIRLSKGLSQKEVYSGVVSKSYAIEFEKGKHDMSVSLFITILDRIFLDFNEFMLIHKDYQQDTSTTYAVRYADAANTGNLQKLIKLEKELAPSKIENNQLFTALCRLSIHTIQQDQAYTLDNYPKKEVEFLQNYLMRINSWTLHEIRLFINCGHFFDYAIHCQLMQTVTKKLKKYQGFIFYDQTFASLLVNFISDALIIGDQHHVAIYMALLDELSQDMTLSFQRDLYLFFTGLTDILWGERRQGEKRCLTIIDHLLLQGYDHFVTSLEIVLKTVSEKD